MNPTGTEQQVCQDIAARRQKGVAKYGTTKQSNKTPPADIRRAKKIKSAYDEAKKRGAIEHDKN